MEVRIKRFFWLGLIVKLAVSFLTDHDDIWFIWSIPSNFFGHINQIGIYYPPLAYIFYGLLSPFYFFALRYGGWMLRLPYIAFDILILFLLLKLVSHKQRAKTLILWWFNPVVIFSIYAMGHVEIIQAALVVLSVYLIKRRQWIAGLSFSAAIAFKTMPIIALPPITLSMKNNWRSRLQWFFGSLVLPVGLGLIFWVVTKADLINSYYPKVATRQLEFNLRPDVILMWLSIFAGGILYLYIIWIASRRKIKTGLDYAEIIMASLAAMFIANPANLIHRFVLIVPVLVYVLVKRNWSSRWIWIFSLMLLLGYVYTWPVQWGLLRNWYVAAPERPALRELVAPWIKYEHLALVFQTTSSLILFWISWKILKIGDEVALLLTNFRKSR
ncbi:hypothetical protein HZB78_06220 [Candidatus Collierbacteria bacterium]|nr:hypothetical protein [Candidatus Collierbacteria bacterium]